MTPFILKYQPWQKHMFIVGCFTCNFALLAASFATTVSGLMATQGFLYGIGFLVLYTSLLTMINEWFVKRRGLAYGLLGAGGGISGAVSPIMAEWLLAAYGLKSTMRILGIAQIILTFPLLFFVKGRLPSSVANRAWIGSVKFLENPHFWVICISSTLQSFAFFIPFIYLPTFATLIGLSPQTGALILAALNISKTLGAIIFGYLSTKISNVFILLFLTMFVSSVAIFSIWGLSFTLPTLVGFAVLYGGFASGFSVLWQTFCLMAEEPQFMFSILSCIKGIGNVAT